MKTLSRRKFIASTATAIALSPALLLNSRAAAADAPRIDPDDPQAKALSYVHESPKPDSICANCQLYTGAADAEWGPCAIFPGKDVAAAGWCSAWVAKAN